MPSDTEPAGDGERRGEAFGRPGPPMSPRSPLRVGFLAAVGAGLAYLLYKALVSAHSVIILIVVAAFLAIGLNPLVDRIQRLGMRRGLAVAAVFLSVVILLGAFGYAVGPPVASQITDFVHHVPSYLRRLERNHTVASLDHKLHFIRKLRQFVTSAGTSSAVAQGVFGIGKAVASGLFNTVTVLILTLYFLSSFNQIKRAMYGLVPRSRRERVSLIGDEILTRVGGYVGGAIVIALIAGTSTLIWLTIFGVPYPYALAVIVTITDVIPLIGATIGAVVVTAAALFTSIPVGIATGVFYIVYQQVENYVIYPRVMKRAVDIHPAAAIVGVLIGGSLFGVVGALLAIPVTAGLQLVIHEVIAPRLETK